MWSWESDSWLHAQQASTLPVMLHLHGLLMHSVNNLSFKAGGDFSTLKQAEAHLPAL